MTTSLQFEIHAPTRKNLRAHGGGIFFNRMRRNRYISPKPLSPASEFFCAFSLEVSIIIPIFAGDENNKGIR